MQQVPFATFPGIDKLGHAAFYLVLGGLTARALGRRRRGVAWSIAVGFALLYGGALEVGQAFVDRDPNLWDWIADGIGAAVGAALGIVATDTHEESR